MPPATGSVIVMALRVHLPNLQSLYCVKKFMTMTILNSWGYKIQKSDETAALQENANAMHEKEQIKTTLPKAKDCKVDFYIFYEGEDTSTINKCAVASD